MSDSGVHYVYAIARAGMDTKGAPAGIGGSALQLVSAGEVAAIASALDGDEYTPALIEERSGDVEWLAPRAQAHDAVVSWAADPGPVIPLHMWTVFSDAGAIRTMLERRSDELHLLLRQLDGADEYGLRVYVDPAELETTVSKSDPAVTDLERTAAESRPGQRYLLERKLQRTRRDAARALAARAADAVYDALRANASAAARDEIPAPGTADGSAVLSAAFLIPRADLDAFRAAVTRVVREYEPRGFRFAFTGPWPAYHFASMA